MKIEEKKKQISPIKLLKNIIVLLEEKRKKELNFVIILSVLSSIAESISLALLIPFIGFFLSPESYAFNKSFEYFLNLFNLNTSQEILKLVSLSFIFAIILSGTIRIKYIKLSNKLTENITSDFRIKLFNFLLKQEYSYYFKHGSQEILSNLAQKTGSIVTIIFSAINIFNAILISLAIIIVLILNEPIYTGFLILILISFFYLTFKVKSQLILKKGEILNHSQNKIIDIFENTVGYLPEIIIYNLEKFFFNFFSSASKDSAKSSSYIRTTGLLPRVYLEMFIIVIVIIIIFFLSLGDKRVENNIIYLTILAFGAQKILPLINSIYNFSVSFKGATPIVSSFLNVLNYNSNLLSLNEDDQKNTSPEIIFKRQLEIKNLSYKYNNSLKKILNNISLKILKGEKVVLKGQTGSGKSTLVNIISGLLDPLEGKIIVDDKEINSINKNSWQKNISIVPQTVFLSDSSILENIAIGYEIDEINLEKAKEVAKIAQIDSFIEKLPNQYSEKVGERGVRLSGGQRQRIGIARALYRDASIIILDEPTNALDKETEKLVMDSISNLGKDITLIMISHSNNLLQYFDQVIDLDKIK